jgi:hypothetical protein
MDSMADRAGCGQSFAFPVTRLFFTAEFFLRAYSSRIPREFPAGGFFLPLAGEFGVICQRG